MTSPEPHFPAHTGTSARDPAMAPQASNTSASRASTTQPSTLGSGGQRKRGRPLNLPESTDDDEDLFDGDEEEGQLGGASLDGDGDGYGEGYDDGEGSEPVQPDYYMEKIHDVRFAHRRLEFYIEWKDFPAESDFTWEPQANLPNDKDAIKAFKEKWLADGKVWPTAK